MSAYTPQECQALASADPGPAAAPAASDATAGRPPRRATLSRWVAPAVLLTLIVAWSAVAGVLTMKWRDAIAAEEQHNANLASILQEQTVRVLATADQATLRLRDAVRGNDLAPGDIVRFAAETGLAPKILLQLSLVGPDGRFVGSNLDPDGSKSGHVDLSEREHIRVHLAPQRAPGAPAVSAGGLFIGKPVLGKVSGRWTIQLSRYIQALDGRSLGVVVASLDSGYFEEVYRGVALGSQGGVVLVGSDATVRTRVIGGQSGGIGTRLSSFGPAGQGYPDQAGHYQTVSTIDHIERLVSYHRVADYPLYVIVVRATQEALASWRDTRTMAVLLTTLLSVAMVAAAVIFHLGLRRLEDSNAALQASEAAAQAANQAKTEFLAAISHELRTPLTSIRGFAELMERRLTEPRFREQAGLIRKAAEYLNSLLTEILDLAKVEAGAMQVAQAPVDLRALVEATASFYAVTAAEKGLALHIAVADSVPASVTGDELRLKQILNNLLSNAFKFTEAGRVAIEADCVETPDAGPGAARRLLRLHVVDTGPGIPEHLHGRVFERFRQGDDRVAFQHGGTGLGLALSRALAELMGGTLTLQSTPGQGARFTLSLPLTAA